MSAQTSAILGYEHETGMRFKDPDDSEIEADLVMMAVGIRPNAAFAARLHCGKGVVVIDIMQSFDPRIYAIGECVEHRQVTRGPRTRTTTMARNGMPR
jgi:nitrite reductase (NADH) large subunit